MNREELKRLAEAATPGPWASEDSFEVITTVEQRNSGRPPFPIICVTSQSFRDTYHLPDEAADANANYIAAANPQTILKLLAMVEVCENALKEYAKHKSVV